MSTASSIEDRVREVERKVDRQGVRIEHLATREELSKLATLLVITQVGVGALVVAVLGFLI